MYKIKSKLEIDPAMPKVIINSWKLELQACNMVIFAGHRVLRMLGGQQV